MCLLTFHTENIEKGCTHASDVCILLFQGQGPLWTASFNGHLNVVKTLLAGGANVNQGDEVGNTYEIPDAQCRFIWSPHKSKSDF